MHILKTQLVSMYHQLYFLPPLSCFHAHLLALSNYIYYIYIYQKPSSETKEGWGEREKRERLSESIGKHKCVKTADRAIMFHLHNATEFGCVCVFCGSPPPPPPACAKFLLCWLRVPPPPPHPLMQTAQAFNFKLTHKEKPNLNTA